jgi:hypothetical protein
MSEVQFYRTRAGRDSFQRSLPELLEQIRGLTDVVEKLVRRLDVGEADRSRRSSLHSWTVNL